MTNKIEALSKGVHTTESANGRGYIKIGFGSLAELHAADDELRALLAEASAQQPKTPVAESLAQMITEWVDTGIKMGTDWRPRLASVIALRLARFSSVERQEPVGWINQHWSGKSAFWHFGADLPADTLCPEFWKPLYTSPPAPVAVAHPFTEKVVTKLRRFQECADDSQGADIGRHWFDLLTQLGLLNRVQRSPALWEITQQGEDCLNTPQ